MAHSFPTIFAAERKRFDKLLERALGDLPAHLQEMLGEVPLIVEDWPSDELLKDMEVDPEEDDLLGMHWGTPMTERSVEAPPDMPDHLYLFRGPIIEFAGDDAEELDEQIRITLLHEIGHHFGLDEDDLDRLGYA